MVLLPKGEYKATSRIERMYNYTYLDPVKPLKVSLIVQGLRCPHCGYEWVPKTDKLPKVCPSCSIRFLDEVEVVDSPELSKELREKIEYAEKVIKEGKELEGKLISKIKSHMNNVKEEYGERSKTFETLISILTDLLKTLGYSIELKTDPKKDREEVHLVKEVPTSQMRIPITSRFRYSDKKTLKIMDISNLGRVLRSD